LNGRISNFFFKKGKNYTDMTNRWEGSSASLAGSILVGLLGHPVGGETMGIPVCSGLKDLTVLDEILAGG
jgi:hypothetical protein